MVTTPAWLEANDQGEYALVAVFDGVDLGYTTTSDLTGINTAYAATDWGNIRSGLMVVGSISQRIDLFEPKLPSDRIQISILDHDAALAETLLGVPSSVDQTYLLTDAPPTATYLAVQSHTGFPASGSVYVGQERMTYTTLETVDGQQRISGLTRGKNSLYAANGQTTFKRYHRVDPLLGDEGGVANAPAVSTTPQTWANRQVGIFLHHKEGSTWSTKANAKHLWTGIISEWGEAGDGRITISLKSVLSLLSGKVLANPWSATLQAGMYVDRHRRHMVVEELEGDDYAGLLFSEADGEDHGWATWQEIRHAVQVVLDAAYTTATVTKQISLVEGYVDDQPKLRFFVNDGSEGFLPAYFGVRLDRKISFMLGFTHPGIESFKMAGVTFVDAFPVHHFRLNNNESIAPFAPVEYLVSPDMLEEGDRVFVENETGTFLTQAAPTSAGDSEGIVKFGSTLYGVTRGVSGSNTFLTVKKSWKKPAPDDTDRSVRLGASGATPVAKQVWLDGGAAGKLLLGLGCSTGSSGYNHTSWDVHGLGIGLGLPFSLFDEDSFLDMDEDYSLVIDEPTSYREILERMCANLGRYPILRNGQLYLTPPGFAADAHVAEELTEDTKASPDDRMSIRYSETGIINSISIEDKGADDIFHMPGRVDHRRGEPLDQTITVLHAGSVSDHGMQRGPTFDGTGLVSIKEWRQYVVGPALSYFSRPCGIIRRTINARLAHLLPGDLVKFTENSLIDPRTGTRGVSGLAAFVTSTSFDFQSGTGDIEAAFIPAHPASKFARFAPSAKIARGLNEYCIDFERGSTQYLKITDAAQTGLEPSTTFTVEAWINLETVTDSTYYNVIAGKWAATAERSFRFYYYGTPSVANAVLALGLKTTDNDEAEVTMSWATDAGITVTAGTWYHVAVTCSLTAEEVKFYVNGNLEKTSALPGGWAAKTLKNNTTDFTVGREMANSFYFDGKMDDLRFWSVVRSAGDIDAYKSALLTGSESDLELYLKFENNAQDTSTNANHTTAMGTPTYSTDVPFEGIGYDGNITLTCEEREFARAADDVDVAGFAAGDEVTITELSPALGTTPLSWTRTILTVNTGSNTMTLDADLNSGDTFDYDKDYIVEYANISSVQTAQRAKCWLADDATGSTGYAAKDANLYGTYDRQGIAGNIAIDYDGPFIRPHAAMLEAGSPLSVHKVQHLLRDLNVILQHRSANTVLCMPSAKSGSITRSFNDAGETLLVGPLWIPLIGSSPISSTGRSIRGKVRFARATGAGTVYLRLYSASGIIWGTDEYELQMPRTYRVEELSTTSTDPEFQDLEISPILHESTKMGLGTWLWVTGECDASTTGILSSITLAEGRL